MLLETNLDDISGELLGNTFSVLLNDGALDVFATPIVMKKNRPAYMLSVLCEVSVKEKIKKTIFRNTTTFGIREISLLRTTLRRDFTVVFTQWGSVRIKHAYLDDECVTSAPEFDDCLNVAQKAGKTVKEVIEMLHYEMRRNC